MKSLIIILSTLLLINCSRKISEKDCFKSNTSIVLRNSNYAYNCGFEHLNITNKKEIKFFCDQLNQMKALSMFTQVNRSRGLIEIYYKNSPRVCDLTFVLGSENKVDHYVFNIGAGNFYRNDTLAKYLIWKMKIKNINSIDSCRSIVR